MTKTLDLQAAGEFYKRAIYPVQDRIMQCVNKLNLPFYLTGATAFNRFTLSGRFTRDLEYQMHDEPNFREFAEEARAAIMVEFAGQAEKDLRGESAYNIALRVDADNHLRVSLRCYTGYHVDSARPGGVIPDSRYGNLDYWQNICADILAREAGHGIGDAVDLWWMAKNYQLHWHDMAGLAQKKNSKVEIGRIGQNIQAVTLAGLSEIPWVIDKNPATVHAGLETLRQDLVRGQKNSLAPEPFDEH